MKRILAFVMALLMLLLSATTFVACDDEGTPSEHTHSFGAWETVTSATCASKGARVRVCGCGETETEEIAPTGEHDLDENGKCRVCSHTHSFGAWETVKPATCVAKGICVRACDCGVSETGELPVSNTHAYDNGVCTVCGASKSVGNVNVNVKVDENGVRWAQDEWGTWREYDNLPDEELDYDDEPISMLYWIGGEDEFEQSEEVDDAALSAIYKRNMAIQTRLGVELALTGEPGDIAHWKTFVARVQTALDGGMHDFDIVAGYARAVGSMATRGLTANISAIENSYIDLEKPWWPSNIFDNLALENNLYFLTGDMSTNTIYNMNTIFFNKTLVNNKFEQEAAAYFAQNGHVKTTETASKDNPEGGDTASNMIYEMVYAGKWTIDEFLALCEGTYVDSACDGLTVDDTYGFTGVNYGMGAFYSGCNLRMLEPTSDGTVLKVSDDWVSPKTVKLIAKLKTLFSTNNFHNIDKTGASSYMRPFANGRCYFSMDYMKYAYQTLAKSTKVPSYGVLPSPKWDTYQTNYYTNLGNEFSLYSIFVDFDTRGDEQGTLTMLTAVLECWASEAFRKTTPVIFELSMKLKALPTPCEADMCEYVRASIELDLSRVLGTALSGDAEEIFQMDTRVITAAIEGTEWSTVKGQYYEAIKNNLANFIRSIRGTMV